jgi:phage replication-related protein YjqB (UPF0714/DUF867 family)
MATTRLPQDFKDFLRLLRAHHVEYLLIGGYAVSYHGYARATADMDIWVARTRENALRLVAVLQEFGFESLDTAREALVRENQIVRMGIPPMRIELATSISGVTFEDCYRERVGGVLDGESVDIISLAKLKENKRVSGRLKDLADLEQLP